MWLIASLDITSGFVLYVVLWSFIWEGGKASLVLFVSLLFLMKNISFATFGSIHRVTCCQTGSKNWCCIYLYFAFTSLAFPCVGQLCLFPHFSPQASHSIAAVGWDLCLCPCFSLAPNTSAAFSLLIREWTDANKEPTLLRGFSLAFRYISFLLSILVLSL